MSGIVRIADKPPPSKQSKVRWLWVTLPFFSLVAFYLLFNHFARRIELTTFTWPPVWTNVLTTLSNSPSGGGAWLQPAPAKGLQVQQPEGGRNNNSAGLSATNSVSAKATQLPDRLTAELRLRMLWAVSAVLFTALCLALTVYILQIINEVFKPHISVIVGSAALIILLYVTLVSVSKGPIPPEAGGKPAEQMFQVMANEEGADVGNLNELLRDKKMPTLKSVRSLVTIASAAAKLGFIVIAIAACVVMLAMRIEQDAFAGLSQPTDPQIDHAKFQYERRVEITISLLQVTACALVAGVVEVWLLYNMASYYVDWRLQNDIRSFGQSLATISGLMYSGFLAAIYLPLIAGQRAIGRELIDSHGGNKITGQGTKYVAQLADPDPKKAPMLAAIFAVLSPILATFLTRLASSLIDNF